jgi:hypothetical protein
MGGKYLASAGRRCAVDKGKPNDEDWTMAKAGIATISGILFCIFLLGSCSGPRQAETLKREDLFSIGYGTSETEIDFSSPASDHFDAAMREGIFLFLDSGGKKILKLTSYGDLLSLIYDPATLDRPKALTDPGQAGEGDGATQGKKGRPAFAASFMEPSRLAVDSSQNMYVADRLSDPENRVYDPLSGAYCDRVVRRFGVTGAEAGYLGQEGPGGTPFPFILSLTVLNDDSLVVVSASESLYLVHRFAASGSLLASMRMSRSSLPVPKALGSKGQAASPIYANLDSIVPELRGENFDILVKIDYYRAASGDKIMPNRGTGYAGSWILNVDGKSGSYGDIVDVSSRDGDEEVPEFLGAWNDRLYLISREDEAKVVDPDAEPSWSLESLDRSGRIRGRYRLSMPKGSGEIAALKLSSGGQIFGLAKREANAAVFWWRLGK